MGTHIIKHTLSSLCLCYWGLRVCLLSAATAQRDGKEEVPNHAVLSPLQQVVASLMHAMWTCLPFNAIRQAHHLVMARLHPEVAFAQIYHATSTKSRGILANAGRKQHQNNVIRNPHSSSGRGGAAATTASTASITLLSEANGDLSSLFIRCVVHPHRTIRKVSIPFPRLHPLAPRPPHKIKTPSFLFYQINGVRHVRKETGQALRAG